MIRPSPVFAGLEMYSLGHQMASVSGSIRFYFFVKRKKKENKCRKNPCRGPEDFLYMFGMEK
jgi:hypothetical protein